MCRTLTSITSLVLILPRPSRVRQPTLTPVIWQRRSCCTVNGSPTGLLLAMFSPKVPHLIKLCAPLQVQNSDEQNVGTHDLRNPVNCGQMSKTYALPRLPTSVEPRSVYALCELHRRGHPTSTAVFCGKYDGKNRQGKGGVG